jgi:hypothetical protein
MVGRYTPVRAARFTELMTERSPTQRFTDWRVRAHPFFWVLLTLLIPAIAVAAVAPSKTPGYALDSGWLYRLEVAGACFLALFVLALLLWLAYSGRTVGNVQLPGGAGMSIPPPDPDLDDAAEGLAGYKQKTDRRLEKIEENMELLTLEDEPEP